MDNFKKKQRLTRKQLYRKRKQAEGIGRLDFEVKDEVKKDFEILARVIAEEYLEPYSERDRIAKAKRQLFEEMMQGIKHEFSELRDKISALRDEVQVLAPSMFKSKIQPKELPEAIRALPDAPKELKQYLAASYTEAERAKAEAKKLRYWNKRLEELKDVAEERSKELEGKLKKAGL